MYKTFLALFSTFSVAGSAHAGGFSTARFGGERGGHPAADTPTAVYYNPAALTQGAGTRFYLEGLFVHRTVDYTRPLEAVDNPGDGTPSGALDANAGRAELNNFIVSPYAGAVSDFGVDGLAVAFAFYVPFGGQAEWDKNQAFEGSADYPGAVDGVQRWSNIEGASRQVYYTAAAAYEIPDTGLSLGLALNAIRADVSLIRARNAMSTDDLVSGDGTLVEGRSFIDADGTSVSLGIGALYEPIDGLRFAVSYQSQPDFGEQSLRGTLDNKFGAGEAAQTDIVFTQEIPDIVRAGVAYRINPAVEVRASFDYQRWSVLERQCVLFANEPDRRCKVNEDGSTYQPGPDEPDAEPGAGIIFVLPRDYDDTFGVRVGASYWPLPELVLDAGLSYDSNAVPDATIDPSLMDMDKIIAVLGAGYELLEGDLALMLSYTEVFYFDRTTEPREMTLELPSRTPDSAGSYEQTVRLLSLGAQYRF